MSKRIDPNDSQSVLSALLRQSLQDFARKALLSLQPMAEYREPKHLPLLCAWLLRVHNQLSRRLIINLPPRVFKSFFATVCFSAWHLGHCPGDKIMIVSHSQKLAGELADQIRLIMQSDWYGRAFETRVRDDFDRQMHFQTTAGGGVYATSIDAGVTGHGADIIIVDDPLDAGEVSSAVRRRNVIQAYDGKLTSRLNNQAEGIILVVHQRLHPEDLSGHLLARGGFEQFVAPLVADTRMLYEVDGEKWDRPEGDVLDPTSYTNAVVREKRANPRIFLPQYQQSPGAETGEIVQRGWFPIAPVFLPSCNRTFLTFDLAQSAGENSSYSCCLVFKTDGTHHYLCSAIRIKDEYPGIKDWVLRLIGDHVPEKILMERAGFGSALLPELEKIYGDRVVEVPRPTQSKVDRLLPHVDTVFTKKVILVGPAVWHDAFLDEIVQFPGGNYDDQIDALTQYLDYVKSLPPRYKPKAVGVSSSPLDRHLRSLEKRASYGLRDPRRPAGPFSYR